MTSYSARRLYQTGLVKTVSKITSRKNQAVLSQNDIHRDAEQPPTRGPNWPSCLTRTDFTKSNIQKKGQIA